MLISTHFKTKLSPSRFVLDKKNFKHITPLLTILESGSLTKKAFSCLQPSSNPLLQKNPFDM